MPDQFNLPQLEEKILRFWKDRDIFNRSVENRRHGRRFVFFEGPPYANGRPGIHHFPGRVIKDLFLRYKTMRGFLVERHAGWDTHGLPIEIEAEKALGIKSKKDIEKIGIGLFNQKARESIWKYKEEWERLTERIGFWLDLARPYITYEWKYIESLWWIIGQINKRKLLYKGHKVLPWCPRCGTALSSHEVAQGYEDITEKSVYVKFKLKNPESLFKKLQTTNYKLQTTYLLAWTTTPWTLPGNVALAVGKSIKYSILSIEGKEGKYILAQDLVEKVLNTKYVILDTVSGKDLVGLGYEPLFNIPALKSDKSYKVYNADFVTTEEGTGVVHTAVMYGEDDYELGKKVGLPMHHTVTEDGEFTAEAWEAIGKEAGPVRGREGSSRTKQDVEHVRGFVRDSQRASASNGVKSADKDIIEYLRSHGLLFKTENYTHSYPFCWRCESPLIYYARDSWFVAMSKLRKQLVKNNNKIHWYPAHLKHGRFGEFIKEAKDWAFSRERYWGTPLPVWQCQTGKSQTRALNKLSARPSTFRESALVPNSKESGCGNYLVVGSLDDLEKHRYQPASQFYILRHGLSEKDIDHGKASITAGRLENDKYHLTPEGMKQIETVADHIKKEGGVDLIWSSPFLRTKETAHIVAKTLGLKVHFENRLKELDHGSVCEGKEHKNGAACLAPGFKPDFDTKYGDGESWKNVKHRMYSAIKELDEKQEGRRILIVSHGDPLWILEGLLLGLSEKEMIEQRDKLYTNWGQLKKIEFGNYPRNENGEIDIHRPYVDQIELKCPECAGKMKRVPEVVDVWFDSGSMPYAQWHYPFENKRHFNDSFPADFIAEGIDMTRGWFYTLLAVSTTLGRRAPFKNVISYSHVLDKEGQKMSKSRGNTVDPWEVIEKFGVDAARWYFYTVNDPADPKLFVMDDVRKTLNSFVMTMLNSLRFLDLYGGAIDKQPRGEPANILDRWLLSRLGSLAKVVSASLDAYDPTSAARAIEHFVVNDWSNWWLRRSRERFQRPASKDDLNKGLRFFRFVLIELSKLMAPFAPFLADHVYKRVSNRKESVHLEDWVKIKKKWLDGEVEKQMEDLRGFVSVGLALRKEKSLKTRQPLASITIKREQKFAEELERLIKDELNVKNVLYDPAQDAAAKLDEKISHELMLEGYAREIVRQIQDMRKEAKYKIDEKIFGAWNPGSHSTGAQLGAGRGTEEKTRNTELLEETMEKYGTKIASDALLKEFNKGHNPRERFDIEKEIELKPQVKIWLGVRK